MNKVDEAWALLLAQGFPLPSDATTREAAINAIDAQYYQGPMIAGPWYIDDAGDWVREIFVSEPRKVETETHGAWEWDCHAAMIYMGGKYARPSIANKDIHITVNGWGQINGPRCPIAEVELAKQWCDAQLLAHGWLLK